MKKRIFNRILLLLFLVVNIFSCTIDFPVELHELRLCYINEYKREIYMEDLTINQFVKLDYSYTLFQMDFLKLLQIKGHPIFTFWYSDKNYYRK